MSKKRVLSCIQPTGEIHIGNYFGAVRNWVDIQDKYDCVYGVVDLHAMTMPYDPARLRENTTQMFIDLLACGIDPKKSVLFVQSLVPQHTELTWIFSCVTSYGELSRMTQFKDKTSQLEAEGGKKNFISAGLFTYPVLMAADILIYKAHYVPVGKDQEQHLEMSRNIAVRFNNQFGDYFPEPAPLYTELPKVMSLADPTRKMSKSLGEKHYIGLFESEDSIRKKVKTAVTDTGSQPGGEMSPGVANLFSIIRACGNLQAWEELNKQFLNGTLKYSELKNVTADSLVNTLRPLREKRTELNSDRTLADKLMHEASAVARDYTTRVLDDVKGMVGLIS
ncbi:MAG: tryptophan--tRNA ligase [Bacteroidales bacterium]|nr:tryptophan--tRNA ligase [Bacteroidales bacterium]